MSAAATTETAEQLVASVVADIKKRDPHETEFHQAAEEILTSLIPLIKKQPELFKDNVLRRFVEPERVISFAVPWADDKGAVHVERGWRVQFNSALGPYKGGLRFHPSVNLSILKFLGLEQCVKNALTMLPLGGGKGGATFDPKGKSDAEVMRFCQAFMRELQRHIGPNVDVPAGDIGVGGREIGYLFGTYARLTNDHAQGVLTGKDFTFGGSRLRPQATGYGAVAFLREALKAKGGQTLNNKTVIVSGSGNVAQYAAEKCIAMGAKVVSMSDSAGSIYVSAGIDAAMLQWIMELKNVKRGRIAEVATGYAGGKGGVVYTESVKGAKSNPIWANKCDVAMPCATQNELQEEDAKALVANGTIAVVEGANMPTTPGAVELLQKAGLIFVPGKASNAGGVACSGLEMGQNSMRLQWTAEEVDQRLDAIMVNIHEQCVAQSHQILGDKAPVDYVMAANCSGFSRLATAMSKMGF